MRFTLKNLRFLQYIDYQNVRKTEFLGCQSQEMDCAVTKPILLPRALAALKVCSRCRYVNKRKLIEEENPLSSCANIANFYQSTKFFFAVNIYQIKSYFTQARRSRTRRGPGGFWGSAWNGGIPLPCSGFLCRSGNCQRRNAWPIWRY